MPVSKEKLTKILTTAFPDAIIKITDMVGAGDHYEIEVTDKLFENKSKVMQHRIVNNALKEVLKGDLHAVVIKTKH